MARLGSKAPDFSLPEVVTGKKISLADFDGKKGLLVMFICQHCPYVQHVKDELIRLGRNYAGGDMAIVAVSSNDASRYAEDSPQALKEMARRWGLAYPLCYDEDQSVAKAYTAACTPDFFLYNDKRELVYRGQLDDSRPENAKPVTGRDLRGAMDSVLAGRPVGPEQKPSMGCSIKWKPGNEPAFAR
jgi:peroxiredoxin